MGANSFVKTDELIRGFVRSGGRNGIKDGASGKGKRSSFSTFDAPPAVDVKWWMGVVGIAVLMLAGSFGLFWTLRRQWRVDGIQNQVVYSAGGNDVGMIQVNESVAVDGVLLPEALVGLTMNATDPVASTVESEEHQSNSNEETPTSATPLNSETTDACGRTTQVAGAEEDGASNSVDELKNSDIPPMDQSSSTVRGCETLNDPIPTANSAEATEEVVAPVLLSFDETEESAGSDPLGWWNNWKAGLRV